MENRKINVCLMSDQAVDYLRQNAKSERIVDAFKSCPNKPDWLHQEFPDFDSLFIKQNFLIDDFELKTSSDGDYKTIDLENSLVLYNSFKNLPLYLVCDERFWLWVNFEKGYKAALQSMPIVRPTRFENHWLFSGTRRGMVFGVLSRCFLRVMLTADWEASDPFELTRFAIEKSDSFLHCVTRNSGSLRSIVRATLKAEKEYLESKEGAVGFQIFKAVPKEMAKRFAVRLCDSLSEEEAYDVAKDAIKYLAGNQSEALGNK